MSQPAPVPAPSPQAEPTVAVLPLEKCPSCGEEVRGRYCSGCGQSHADVRVPFWKWLGDYLTDTFHLESNLARSAGMMLRRPGGLTVAYLEGQRSLYVRPFRLYLTASFLYFLALTVIHPEGLFEVRSRVDAPGEVVVTVGPSLAELDTGPQAPAPRPLLHEDSEFKRRLNRIAMSGSAGKEQAFQAITQSLPKAMFVLVPVFALLLHLLYRKTGRFYAEHFVFTLHFHAFAFLAAAAGIVAGLALGPKRLPVMQPLILGYLFLSLRRVYGQSLMRTAFKTAVLYGGYGLMLLLTVTGVALGSLYFAD
ncbi:DUF3667 domain-containing protein [Archangium violaceum]|uniref:DUF3667 domain-containing protein n=1 Tax=Archangium violaceum TaxID=83451 RepID=UPI00194FC840|nr:DUF3667 domain-containing protein [Archangium violaceum]QRN94741.1 DUF3667 domain-containing protein [Archangium violaceum]